MSFEGEIRRLPSWTGEPDAAALVIEAIDAWSARPELRRILDAFAAEPVAPARETIGSSTSESSTGASSTGESSAVGSSTGGSSTGAALRSDALLPASVAADRLHALDAAAARAFDFRRGRERNLAPTVTFGPELDQLVLGAAPALGLAGQERPSRRRYDALVMTGGMIRACMVKPAAAAELLRDGLSVREIVFLGAHRPFAGDEHAVAVALGLLADGVPTPAQHAGAGETPANSPSALDDEADAMIAGMRRAFRLGPPDRHESSGPAGAAAWRVDGWTTDGVALSVVTAPSSDPGARRANTADTFRHWAATRDPGIRSVLVLTTPIYVPYQNAVAVETLGIENGLVVETIGASASASDLGAQSQVLTVTHHLQELRAAIQAMLSLRQACERRSSEADPAGRTTG